MLRSRPSFRRLVLPLLAMAGVVATMRLRADEEPVTPRDPKEALGWFNGVVGEWRGAGQVRRGSTLGAWFETGEFVWDFKGEKPAVVYEVEKGRHLDTARITFDPEAGDYVVTATLPNGGERTYRGAIEKEAFVADSPADEDDWVHRLVVTPLGEKRLLVRYERRKSAQRFYSRVGEVGATRRGTSLAVAGGGEPECIVTGGRGTMLVSHAGESYYVCCTGCRQAFEADPEGIIAAHEKERAERKPPAE